MEFKVGKYNALNKFDKSKKRSIDSKIKPLVDKINASRNYYSTSSCSGRIVVAGIPNKLKKPDIKWIYKTHEPASFSVIKKKLNNIKIDSPIWLKQEAAIIHVVATDLDYASALLELARNNGFKRSGISTIKKRILLEIISTEHMDVPLGNSKRIFVTDNYLKEIIKQANKKLKKTHEKINKLVHLFDKMIAAPIA